MWPFRSDLMVKEPKSSRTGRPNASIHATRIVHTERHTGHLRSPRHHQRRGRSEKVSSPVSSSADPEPEVWILCPPFEPIKTATGDASRVPLSLRGTPRLQEAIHLRGPNWVTLHIFIGQVRPETVDGRWRTGIICAARPHHDEGYV